MKFHSLSLLMLACSFGYATTITITSPVTNVDVPDGPEFATSVLHRPWDMSGLRQIGRDFGFNTIQSTGGIWSGTSGFNANNVRSAPGVGGALDNFKLFVLNPNFLRSNQPNYVPYSSYFTNGTPYGHLMPLDADKYSRLSFRMSLSQANRSNVAVWWTKTFNRLPEQDVNFSSYPDSEIQWQSPQFTTITQPKRATGFRIYDLDPNSRSIDPEQKGPAFAAAAAPASNKQNWSGTIWGFFIQPSDQAFASDNVPVSFDWIRAYDPVSSPEVTITWNSSGLDGFYDYVQLWIDDDNSGFDGDLFIDGLVNDGSYALKTGALPPGDYYVYLRGMNNQQPINVLGTSGYSARIRVGAPPLVEITSPSYTSGEDYAASELGNPWDFSDTGDWMSTAEMSQISINGGIFSAVTDPPQNPPAPESDDRIVMNTKRNGQIVPINTKKYRYFSVRMRVPNAAGYGDIDDKLTRGWLGRLIWWNASITADGSNYKDIPILEGWRTYSVDLWDDVFLEDIGVLSGVPQLGWEELPLVRFFRFDPLEAWFPTSFEIDWMSLNAENTLSNGSYTIEWDVSNTGASNVDVRIFADPENSPGVITRSQNPIHTATNRSLGSDSFVWSPASLTKNTFIRVEIDDGTHVVETTSTTPISTGFFPPTSRTIPVAGDFDGDGTSDLAVFETATGTWYIRPSSGPVPFSVKWGDASMTPVKGDYNGDGVDDLAMFQPGTGKWYILNTVTRTAIVFGVKWGDGSMTPVPGDYNGDGKWDLGLYQQATGNWFARSATGPSPLIVFARNWGNATMVPVSGDYNNDGVYDFGVFQPSTGNWFVRAARSGSNGSAIIVFNRNWGSAAMQPVSGDFNGDGRHDLAVYHTTLNQWFIRKPVGKNAVLLFGRKWGSGAMQRVSGDYNGDGRDDLAMYDGSTGKWYILSGSGNPLIAFGEQWGSP